MASQKQLSLTTLMHLTASASATPVGGTVGDPNVNATNIETSFGGKVGLGVAINVGVEAGLGTSAPTI